MAKVIDLEKFIAAKDQAVLEEISFEQGLALLDQLVSKVESGGIGLEQSVLCYEKGSSLVAHLKKQVSAAEAKLKIIQKHG